MATRTIQFQPDEQMRQALMQLLQEAGHEEAEILLMDGPVPFARLMILEGQALPLVEASPNRRIAGLHHGTTWVSPEFDAPLSDEFELGD